MTEVTMMEVMTVTKNISRMKKRNKNVFFEIK